MNKKNLCLGFLVLFTLVGAGCFPITNAYKSKHMQQASLSWYVYLSDSDLETNVPKKEYRQRIDRYLERHPEIGKEVADKMRECWVTLGMTEEQVVTMVEPQYVLKGKKRNQTIFKYSNVGKFAPGKLFGEGTKIWVTFTDGIVTDITEVDLVIGY